jgi:hypothetical protein
VPSSVQHHVAIRVGQLSLSIWKGTNYTKQNQFDGKKSRKSVRDSCRLAVDDLAIEEERPRLGYYSYCVAQEIRAGLQPSPRPERDREREKKEGVKQENKYERLTHVPVTISARVGRHSDPPMVSMWDVPRLMDANNGQE